MKKYLNFCGVLGILLFLAGNAQAQPGAIRQLQGAGSRFSGGGGSGKGDSLQHRVNDSITIHFRYLDSSRLQHFDTSVTDFTRYYPIPWNYIHLGNIGNAARDLIFNPIMQPGWDHGFHAYDIYNFTVAGTRFYNTTAPFTQLGYLLGSKNEQMISINHTQNLRPNWNMSAQYRFTNSLGYFQNQNTNHNNYSFGSWYQSKNKRYQNFVIVVGNKLQSAENGGIKTDHQYLDSIAYTDRATIPTKLGTDQQRGGDFFSSNIPTGTFYTNATYMMRQQYDLGKKDSVVTDSTVIPLFYPRVRLEHTISYSTYNYRFKDDFADSAYYALNYGIQLPHDTSGQIIDSFFRQDLWKQLVNDFSIYSFPDEKNAQQFFKAGASVENLSGSFDSMKVHKHYYNFFVHGEYRIKTKNQKWDVEAFGRFYINGLNAGDYNGYISLRRLISKKLGYLQVGFQNTNRTPSFVFNPISSFYFAPPENFKKENITNIFASIDNPRAEFRLSGSYYLVSNLAYFKEFYKPDQASTLFNVLEVTAYKQFRLFKHFNWRTWVVLQQVAGNSPINLPFISTRNQIGYDGNLGFRNLLTSFGLELRYFTHYDAPNYSPLQGQFFQQDAQNVRLRAPDITAYLHFKIRTFSAYVRAENLNSFNFRDGGFTNNNVPTVNYPLPGLQIRVGIFWDFIN